MSDKTSKNRYTLQDFDRGMLRIATMKRILHDIQHVDIEYRIPYRVNRCLWRIISHYYWQIRHLEVVLFKMKFILTIFCRSKHDEKLNCFFYIFLCKNLKSKWTGSCCCSRWCLVWKWHRLCSCSEKIIEEHIFCRELFFTFRCISAI